MYLLGYIIGRIHGCTIAHVHAADFTTRGPAGPVREAPMCTRFCPLTEEEAQAVLNQRAGGTRGHAIADVTHPDPLFDAYPGSQVPVFLPRPDGGWRSPGSHGAFRWKARAKRYSTRGSKARFPSLGTAGAAFGTTPSSKEGALSLYAPSMRGTWARGPSASGLESPFGASTYSGSPERGRSFSPACNLRDASRSLRRNRTMTLRQSMTGCRSSWDRGSLHCGWDLISPDSPTVLESSSTSSRNDPTINAMRLAR